MENGIKVFEQAGLGSVRVVMQGDEPWFVAKDVCEALGYQWNGAARIAHVPEEWKRVTSVVTLRGDEQNMQLLSEQGLYFFLGRSDKPAALPYQKWIAGEVLPSIRKSGSYSAPSAPAKAEISVQSEVECALLILKAAGITGNQLAIAADNYYRKRTGISVIEASGVELVAPKQQQLLTPTQLGKELGLSGRKVNLMLAGLGLQRRIGDVWEPTEDGKARGAVLMDTGKRHGDGAPVRQLKWPSDVVNALR